jgi:hypothetical protein
VDLKLFVGVLQKVREQRAARRKSPEAKPRGDGQKRDNRTWTEQETIGSACEGKAGVIDASSGLPWVCVSEHYGKGCRYKEIGLGTSPHALCLRPWNVL